MKVAIVGSGIAGSTLAINLAKNNFKIDMYEMRKAPKAICGGGLGFYALDRIGKMDEEIHKLLIQNTKSYIDSFLVYTSKYTKNNYKLAGERYKSLYDKSEIDGFEMLKLTRENLKIEREHLGIIMDRHTLDEGAVKLAKSYGVNYYNNTKVDPNTLKDYDYVIDARGVDGWNLNTNTFIVAYQEYYPTPLKKGNVMEIYFDNDLFDMGYAWFMPKGETTKIGFGDKVDKVKRIGLHEYMNYVHDFTSTHDDMISFEGAQLPLSGKVKLREGKVFKVGTSAGFIDPLTGGGIRMAIESAIILSKALQHQNPYLYYLMKTAYLRGQIRMSTIARNRLIKMSNERMTHTLVKIKEKLNNKRVTDSIYLEVLTLIPYLFMS